MNKLTISIRRGSTVALPIRVESSVLSYAQITTIANTAPVRITAAAHGLPDGWRTAVMNARGLTDLNAEYNPPKDKELQRVTLVDADTVEFNSVNATGFKTHTANTGQLAFYAPVDLSLYVGARMEIKKKVGGERLALFATPATVTDATDGALELDAANNTLWIRLTDAESTAIEFKSAVFDIELLRANGDIEAVCSADSVITIDQEITTAE